MTTDDRLDKAAPNMLRALKEAYAALGKDPRWKVSTLRLDIIREAIAKAEEGPDEKADIVDTRPREDPRM